MDSSNNDSQSPQATTPATTTGATTTITITTTSTTPSASTTTITSSSPKTNPTRPVTTTTTVATSAPIQSQQNQQSETTTTPPTNNNTTSTSADPPKQSQQITNEPKEEPMDLQAISLQVQPPTTTALSTSVTQPITTTPQPQLPTTSTVAVSQEQSVTQQQQQILQLQVQVAPTTQEQQSQMPPITTTTSTTVTSQPIQFQVQSMTNQPSNITSTPTIATTRPSSATTPTTQPSGGSVTIAATPQLTPISSAQLPRVLPTIQITPQGTTLTLTSASTVNSTSTTTVSQPTNLTVASNQQPTIAPTIIKAEPYRFICCLLDNGVKCDRIAGNASFTLRMQKVVMTKKLNFELDPKVTHGYLCEYHKKIVSDAKKSTTMPRGDSKARNNNANNKALGAASAVAVGGPTNNMAYATADLSRPQAHQRGPITTLQQPVNLKLITNTNQRLTNNHHPTAVAVGAPLNTIPIVRQGNQIGYAHFQSAAAHQNQITNMDVIMSNSNYDNTGGDNVANMGPSSTGIDVDLQQLQVNTLRRYKRHFRVQTRPGLNKMQLAESLKAHFRTLPIIEKEAITYFVYIVKCFRNKLDHNPKAD